MDDGPEHYSQHATQKQMLAAKEPSKTLDFTAIFHRGRVVHGTH